MGISPHAHNYYIQLLTTSGTIGLILYLTMILTFTLNTNLSQRKKLLLILASIICSLTEARDLGIWRCETVTSTFIIFCIWASKKNHPKSVD